MIDQINFENGRHERKFLITHITFRDIENILKLNQAMFLEAFSPRKVNNIYLDSIDLKNYQDNNDGNTKRLKIRVRWYGNLFGKIEKPVLELKIKKGEIGKKLSFPLKSFTLNNNFSFEYLINEVFEKSSLPGWLLEKLKSYQIVLLNSYKRQYFLSSNKKYRITIDSNLDFIEIQNKNNLFKRKYEDRESLIIEIKYDDKNDREVSFISQQFPFRMGKSSKYIMGMNLLFNF
ncbi:MAG: VTC domain-containing protein [Nanoarchaeota archaeon]|nr:VTC domain-containing protein [Nanoarchaeota archaeon]